MNTDKFADNAVAAEPWFRNPWVWLVIAIPTLTVAGGLLTIFLAISNPHIMVDDSGTDDTSATSTP